MFIPLLIMKLNHMLNHICKTKKKKDYWLNVQIVVNLECFIGKSSSKDVYQCVILHVLSHSPPLSCSTKQYNDQAVNTGLCKVLNLWHSGFFYTTRAQWLMCSCLGFYSFQLGVWGCVCIRWNYKRTRLWFGGIHCLYLGRLCSGVLNLALASRAIEKKEGCFSLL